MIVADDMAALSHPERDRRWTGGVWMEGKMTYPTADKLPEVKGERSGRESCHGL
jgi:hypothetical protein